MTDNSELCAILDKVAGPLADACGLPNAAYTDSSFFQVERDEVLAKTWAAIGYASDLIEPGYAVPVEFMGVPLITVLDRAGTIRVFHNVCSHRGMTIVGAAGKVRSVIRCPYHSWSYDFSGDLVSTPHIGGVDSHSCEDFDKAAHGLKPVRFALWMDIIFVNLSGDAAPFDEYIAPLDDRWSEFLTRRDRPNVRPGSDSSQMQLNVSCNWKLAIENYCESYHLPWIHPDLNSYSPLDQHFGITVGDAFSGQGTHQYDLASRAGTQLPMLPDWPKDRQNVAEYVSLYPNTLLGVQADHFFSVIVIPRTSGTCTERLQISYHTPADTDESFAASRQAVLDSWDKVFQEDVFAVEGMQNGRNSPGFAGGVFTPVQDVPTHHFHTWVARRYAAAFRQTKSSARR